MDKERDESEECCERIDAEDARIEAEGKEAKEVLAMVEAVKDYGLVMDACLEEAAKLIPKIEPVQESRFESRIKVALALYDRATGITQKPDIEKYLDRLIHWYEGKDSAPGHDPVLSVPPLPVFTPTAGPANRLANLLLDFLESRTGVIFGEITEDQDERANEERSGAAGE